MMLVWIAANLLPAVIGLIPHFSTDILCSTQATPFLLHVFIFWHPHEIVKVETLPFIFFEESAKVGEVDFCWPRL